MSTICYLIFMQLNNTNDILQNFFNDRQQQHNDMPQNGDIVGQQYIAINIVNVWCRNTQPAQSACGACLKVLHVRAQIFAGAAQI